MYRVISTIRSVRIPDQEPVEIPYYTGEFLAEAIVAAGQATIIGTKDPGWVETLSVIIDCDYQPDRPSDEPIYDMSADDLPVYETSDDDLPTEPSRAATSTEFYFDTEADMAGYCGVKNLDYYGNKPVWARAHGGDCAGRMGEVTVSYNGQPPQMFAWPVMCETHFNEMLGNPV